MKFVSLIQCLGGLCTDANVNMDATNDTDDDNNYARRTNHDNIGSFGIISKEPKNKCSGLTFYNFSMCNVELSNEIMAPALIMASLPLFGFQIGKYGVKLVIHQ